MILEEIRALAIRGSTSPGCACKRYHTQIRSIVETAMTGQEDDRIEAVAEIVAEIWAAMDRNLELFELERDGVVTDYSPRYEGVYLGYMSEATVLIQRLEARGYKIIQNR
jgi:hypothetical protein